MTALARWDIVSPKVKTNILSTIKTHTTKLQSKFISVDGIPTIRYNITGHNTHYIDRMIQREINLHSFCILLTKLLTNKYCELIYLSLYTENRNFRIFVKCGGVDCIFGVKKLAGDIVELSPVTLAHSREKMKFETEFRIEL